MSTDHHPSDQPLHDDCPPCGETRYVDRTPAASARPAREVHARGGLEGSGTDLEDRIERARLRVRVAALERSLAEQERRRRAIVDQYETILERRDYPSDDPSMPGPRESAGDETRRDETDSSDDETSVPLRLIPSTLRSLFP